MEQSLTVIGRDNRPVETRWEVDLAAAGMVQDWARRQRGLLAEEVQEMGLHFPRWVLTMAAHFALVNCERCGEMIVFRDGAARCVACGTPRQPAAQSSELAWVGHLPIPVAGLEQTLRRIRAQPHPAYPLVDVGGVLL